jgi:hypothetical protein
LLVPAIFIREYQGLDPPYSNEEVSFTRFLIMGYIFCALPIPDLICVLISAIKQSPKAKKYLTADTMIPISTYQTIVTLLGEDLEPSAAAKYIQTTIKKNPAKSGTEISLEHIMLLGIKYPLLFYELHRFRTRLKRFIFGDKFWEGRYYLKPRVVGFGAGAGVSDIIPSTAEYEHAFVNEKEAIRATAASIVTDIFHLTLWITPVSGGSGGGSAPNSRSGGRMSRQRQRLRSGSESDSALDQLVLKTDGMNPEDLEPPRKDDPKPPVSNTANTSTLARKTSFSNMILVKDAESGARSPASEPDVAGQLVSSPDFEPELETETETAQHYTPANTAQKREVVSGAPVSTKQAQKELLRNDLSVGENSSIRKLESGSSHSPKRVKTVGFFDELVKNDNKAITKGSANPNPPVKTNQKLLRADLLELQEQQEQQQQPAKPTQQITKPLKAHGVSSVSTREQRLSKEVTVFRSAETILLRAKLVLSVTNYETVDYVDEILCVHLKNLLGYRLAREMILESQIEHDDDEILPFLEIYDDSDGFYDVPESELDVMNGNTAGVNGSPSRENYLRAQVQSPKKIKPVTPPSRRLR